MTSPDSQRPYRVPELKQLARQRLADAARNGGRIDFSSESLGALMRLAADARCAPDALLVLQEMQVQQIELELQLDELSRPTSAPSTPAVQPP